MIDMQFQELGFSENEKRVYLQLAEFGKAGAALLAKKCSLPRSTVYSVLESLVERGLVSQDHEQAAVEFLANPPSAIKHMVDRERETQLGLLSRKDAAAAELVPALAALFATESPNIPRLQYFEGPANVRTMLYEYCGGWQKSIAEYDYTWWGYQDHQFVETYREWLDYYWAGMDEPELIKLFSNKSPTENRLKGKVRNRTIKLVPQQYQFSSTIWILGEYVVTIMLEPIHYAFQLRDRQFAANQRKVFQLLWESRA